MADKNDDNAPIPGLNTWKDSGVRRLASKNGKFSKTSLIHSLTWLFALALYAPLTLLFAATKIELSWLSWTVPAFDVVAISALLGLASGTYLSNNHLKNVKAQHKNGAS